MYIGHSSSPSSFSHYWLSYTFLIKYSKAKLKINGDRASRSIIPFRTGEVSDICLHILLLCKFYLDTILLTLTSFMGVPDSMRILYLPPNWIIRFLGNAWIANALSYFIPILSEVFTNAKYVIISDLLLRNAHWWHPIILSTYGVNF